MTKNWYNELQGKTSVTELLGDTLNETDRYGNDAFLSAVKFGFSELAVDMVENLPGLDVNKANKLGLAGLHYAPRNKDVAVMKALLDKGANLEDTDMTGSTPVLLSGIYNFPEGVDMLLDAGANIHHVNTNGQNFLHMAAYSGNTDLITLALEHGIPNSESKQGWDAARFASLNKQDHVGKFIEDWYASNQDDGTTDVSDVLGLDDAMELVDSTLTSGDDVA